MPKIDTTLGMFILISVGVLAGIISWTSIQIVANEQILSSLEIQRISQTILKEIVKDRILYIIDKGEGEILEYQIIPSEGATVFSILQKLAQRENFQVESKIYEGMGVFIESIAGVKNGTNNKYWQYWVNGELPMISADKKEVKGGDKVEWKFAPASF